MSTYSLEEIKGLLQEMSAETFEDRYGRLFLVRLLSLGVPLKGKSGDSPLTETLPNDRWENPTPIFHTSYGRMSLWAHSLRFGGHRTTLTVGRDPSVAVLLNSWTVSWRHASLCPVADGLSVTDLGSRNGTRINGQLAPPHRAVVAPIGAALTFSDVSCSLFDVRGLRLFAARLGKGRTPVAP